MYELQAKNSIFMSHFFNERKEKREKEPKFVKIVCIKLPFADKS